MYHYHALTCPHCQREDRVQKVSALVAHGTTTGMHYGWTVGRVGRQRFHGHTVAWSRQQTLLAGQLAPPGRPLPLIGCAAGIAVLLLVLSLLCIVSEAASVAAEASGAVVFMMAVFVVFPVGLLVVLVRGVRTNAPSSQMAWLEWQRQMQKWQALYYCHRCGGVFVPGSGDFVPAPATRVFLTQP